jgi:hypothetical protein
VTSRDPAPPTVVGRRYREIRSARFPQGLPDRSDLTVLEAFADAWLLIDHLPGGAELVGLADDYDAARAWLTGAEDRGNSED